jgi:hypothetical protein
MSSRSIAVFANTEQANTESPRHLGRCDRSSQTTSNRKRWYYDTFRKRASYEAAAGKGHSLPML